MRVVKTLKEAPPAGTMVGRADVPNYDWPEGTRLRTHHYTLLAPEDVCRNCPECGNLPVRVMERREY